MPDINLKIGDFITDTIGVYEITDIKPDKDGDKSELVYYKPTTQKDKDYTAYIPLHNLIKAGMRKVLTNDEVTLINKGIIMSNMPRKYDYNLAKESIFQNNPLNTLPILNYIWVNQANLSKNDKDLMAQIIDNLAREIAFVTDEKLNEIKEKLIDKLGKLKMAESTGIIPIQRKGR